MAEAHLGHGLAHAARLVGVNARFRLAGRHVAEGTGAGAHLAENHHRRVLLVPALPDVGAAGLFANRHQSFRLHDLPRCSIAFGGRCLDANPVRLSHQGCIRTPLFLGVTGPRRRVFQVDEVCHWRQNGAHSPIQQAAHCAGCICSLAISLACMSLDDRMLHKTTGRNESGPTRCSKPSSRWCRRR